MHLTGEHLTGVHLTGMHLIGVHLEGLSLTGVDLTDIHLLQVCISRRYVWVVPSHSGEGFLDFSKSGFGPFCHSTPPYPPRSVPHLLAKRRVLVNNSHSFPHDQYSYRVV